MFETGSRYYGIQEASITLRDSTGEERKVVYKRRRFIPSAEDTGTPLEHTVTGGERLDNITARYIGDPTQFWRVCDANLVLKPDELTEEAGRVIRISLLHL